MRIERSTGTSRFIHILATAAFVVGFVGCGGVATDGSDEEPLDDKDASFVAGNKADTAGITPGSAEAQGVLEFVNQASFKVLDDEVPLDVRAATNIVDHRNGPDDELGTEDDNLFNSLEELDNIYWVGPKAFERIVKYARENGFISESGRTQPETRQCGDAPEAPAEGCRVVQRGSGGLLIKGDVLKSGEVLENGEVYIDTTSEPGQVGCASCDCGIGSTADPTVIACGDTSISPGLINPHDHLGWASVGPAEGMTGQYEHRHEWRKGLNGKPEIESPSADRSRENILHGELRQLLGGTTSMAGSTNNSVDRGLVRNLDNGKSAGGIEASVDYSTFPLGDVGGEMQTDSCQYNDFFGTASGDSLRHGVFLPHVAEGLGEAASHEFSCLSQPGEHSQDLIGERTSIVHGIGMTAQQIRELAASRGKLVWSPRTNISLYGDTADVITYRNYGIPVALGTDWSITGSINMLHELSCANRFNRKHLSGRLAPSDLWRMATVNGARALGVEDSIGRLEAGFTADVALFSGSSSNPYQRVIDGHTDDVRLVLRGGEALFGDKELVEAASDSADGCAAVEACGSDRLVCVERDTAQTDSRVTFEDLQSVATENSYPFFHCEGDELHEPRCETVLGEDRDQTVSPDQDGDLVRDGADNCPSVFNRPRPLASGHQMDSDGDGKGDPCDPCPADPEDRCSAADFDGDGVPDAEDNCPYRTNPDQQDSNGNGLGDKCDFQTTPYQVHVGEVSPPEKVTMSDLVVTASHSDGIFVQVPPTSEDYDGPQGSGLPVYLDSGFEPSPGEVVHVEGRVEDLNGRTRIYNVNALENTGSGTVPEPVEVDPCTLANDAERGRGMVGSLVKVTDVTVTDVDVGTSEDEERVEFTVGECSGEFNLVVGDKIHQIGSSPQEGDTFEEIVGPLYFADGNYKILPRKGSDIR